MVHVCISSSCPVATVGTDQPSYTVPEDAGSLWFDVLITDGQKAPGQQCEIQVGVVDDTATGKEMILLHVPVVFHAC